MSALPLGRHVEHDERSRAFALEVPEGPLVSRTWKRHCDPYNQKKLGSCTGNAAAGVLMTEPFFSPYRMLTEVDAVKFYELATILDSIPGHYPPDDTGSSGLGVAKALKKLRLIKSYHHAMSLDAALHALTRGPVISGVNWYEGFDRPIGDAAELVISGEVRGGHEVEILSLDVEHRKVGGLSSWGKGWGNHGYFVMSFDTWKRLLQEKGDVTEFRGH